MNNHEETTNEASRRHWIDLGRRAVVCKGFRWMPGMAWIAPQKGGRYPLPEGAAPMPDLRDPATLGCLLALVREVSGDRGLHVATWAGGWLALPGRSGHISGVAASATEAEALVAALEAHA